MSAVKLWSRQRITVPLTPNGGPPGSIEVDTGIFKWAFLAAGDVQVIPLPPLGSTTWDEITLGEPFIGANGNVHVLFTNATANEKILNVFFFLPHSIIGPGSTVPYNT